MHRTLLAFLATILFCALSLSADQPTLPDQFGPWQAEAPSKIQSGAKLFASYGDVHTDVLKEAGLLSTEERAYTSGSDQLHLSLYKFKDPSGAYEFYTQVLGPTMLYVEVGDGLAFEPGHAVLIVGNFVLVTGPTRATLKPDSLSPLVSTLKSQADSSPYPPLRSYLPISWQVFGTQRYAQGRIGFQYAMDVLGLGTYRGLSNEVGFTDGAEAIFAKYKGEHGSGTLLLLEYPTPQLAEQHLHHLEQALPAELKRAGVTVERKASLLSLIFSPTSPQHAQAIRDEVNYDTEVTWNESRHTATDPPIVLIMYKIFIFTGLFLGVATAVGVAFGGTRVIIKKLYPGKVFDRPEDIEVLQLGLSGKKIDPSDMY